MSIVRVKADVAATVHDPSTGGFVALTAGAEYDSADPIVKAHGWAFQSDATAAGARPRVRSVGVEQATANPGELRNR